jgi:hypothetical protein
MMLKILKPSNKQQKIKDKKELQAENKSKLKSRFSRNDQEKKQLSHKI